MTQTQQNDNTDSLLKTNTTTHSNITFEDNRDEITEIARKDLLLNSNSSIHQFTENEWSLLKLCSRPSIISFFKWENSTSSPLVNLQLPLDAGTNDPYWTNLFRTFAFARFDMHIRVQINSTRFHSGRLALVWNPLSAYDRPSGLKPLIWHATSLPHADLDASMSNTAELVIPFQHYYSYLPLYGKDVSFSLGQFTIENLTGLQLTSTTSPVVDGSVWFWMSNVQLYVPTPTRSLFTGSVPLPIRAEAQAGKNSVLEQKLILADEIGDGAADLVHSGTKLIRKGAQFFGLADSPSEPLIERKVMLSNGPMAHGVGVSSAVRLALDPLSGTLTEPTDIATTCEEMDLNNIIKRPALVFVDDITSSDYRKGISVSPNVTYMEDGKSYPTYLSYCASRFAYWRGPLKFRFEFVCSNFHSLRLLVSFIPNSQTISGVGAAALANAPSIVMDLQEKRTFEFVVPYNSFQPYKQTFLENFHSPDEGIPLAYSTGTLSIVSLNDLVYPSSVSSFCQMWVYVSAADGFDLSVPNFTRTRTRQSPWLADEDVVIPFPSYSAVKAEAQAEFLTVDNAETKNLVPVLGNVLSATSSDQSLYGESFMHLSNLLARNTLASRVYFKTVKDFVLALPNAPVLNVQYVTRSVPCIDLISWFSQMYIFWRGSLRYSFLNGSPRNAGGTIAAIGLPRLYQSPAQITAFSVDRDNSIHDYVSSNATHIQTIAMSPNLEIESPYYTQFQNLLVHSIREPFKPYYPDHADAETSGITAILYEGNTDSFSSILTGYINRSAAPDFNLSYVGRPPVV